MMNTDCDELHLLSGETSTSLHRHKKVMPCQEQMLRN